MSKGKNGNRPDEEQAGAGGGKADAAAGAVAGFAPEKGREPVFKAVIFDLDGTLIDSKEDLADATNRMLAAEGYPLWPVEQYGLFLGKGIRNLVCCALPPDKREDSVIDRCRDLTLADYARNCIVKTRLYPGIAQVLDTLSASGVKMAVLSNKPHEVVLTIMDRLFGRWHFVRAVGAGAGLPMKPDPEAVAVLCREMGVSASEVLYVGDSDVDMFTARAAGVKALGVEWGFRGREELERSGAWQIAGRAEGILRVCFGEPA